MAKVAKKAAPAKKGKYYQIISSATHPLKIKPVGSDGHDTYLRPHDSGMAGQQPSLTGHEVEVRYHFAITVMKKVWPDDFVLSEEREV